MVEFWMSNVDMVMLTSTERPGVERASLVSLEMVPTIFLRRLIPEISLKLRILPHQKAYF